ncbi:putative ribonuclease H-like domain-containing protein [Rosa chinensis]|uniref:Putative ribonuclease H-like domain-containing protein n=1 Tax=Rosa chinensis TaxID=74649 RepID=A0A2P6QA69_ROSCH|nr:putative ribonuclease H-like domain-containing protein [Rosa chinensis]
MGDIVGGVCITVNSVTSPDIVEAMACRAACSLAVQFHLSPIMFETDCQSLVSTIEAEGEETSSLGRIIEDINFSLGILVGSSLRHVYREANMAAHNLAKLALHSSFNLSGSGLVPPDIRGFVASHCTL